MRAPALSFALGAWLALQLPRQSDTSLWLATVAAALLAGSCFLWRVWPSFTNRPPGDAHAALMGLGTASAGAALALSACVVQLDHALPAALEGKDIDISATVIGIPVHESTKHETRRHATGRSRLRVRIDHVHTPAARAFAPREVLLSWYDPASLPAPGERWRLTVRLRRGATPGNPGGFDQRRWLFHQGIDARGYVRHRPMARRLTEAPRWHGQALRARLASTLESLGANPTATGLVQALTLGFGHAVDESTRTLLVETGTAHLLAISGMHIGLLGAFGMLAGRLAWQTRQRMWPQAPTRLPRTLPAGLTAIVFATIYAALAGFALSTVRALVMLIVLILALNGARRLPPASALAIALLIVLLADPLALLATGFWLSFGTVGVILWLCGGYQRRRSLPLAALELHCKLGVALLPATAWFFQSGVLIAPLANFVAVPLVSLLIVPLSLCTLLFAVCLPALATPLMSATEWLLEVLLGTLEWLHGATLANVALVLPSSVSLVLCILAIAVATAPRGLGLRWLAAVLLLPVLLGNTLERPVRGFELHVLDVGQGLAALILTPDSTLLYDTGGLRAPDHSQAVSVILPYLRHIGRRRIDTVVISHPDLDHAAGSTDIARHFPKARFYTSQPEALKGIDAERCQPGPFTVVDGVSFGFLHPGAEDTGGDNDRSCVLLVHHGKSRVLLPGDVEARAEARLLARGAALPVTVLVAPHHGSLSSSTPAFIDAFRPQHVVYAAAEHNRFGFPHPTVANRYTVRGIRQYTTGRDGRLCFRFDRNGLYAPVLAWRQQRPRLWHR